MCPKPMKIYSEKELLEICPICQEKMIKKKHRINPRNILYVFRCVKEHFYRQRDYLLGEENT